MTKDLYNIGITLTDDHFKVIANGKVFERNIENDSEFNEL